MPEVSCLMYLLRHGATANNLAKPPRLQGQGLDAPLSQVGREQAKQTAAFLIARDIHAVYSSPLVRARETAEIIAEPRGFSVATVDALTEADVGRWEGRSWREIEENDREEYGRFVESPEKYGYSGGESLPQVQMRVVPAMRRLMEQNLGRQIVVVTHNVVNRMFWAHLLGLSVREARSLSQENCGISVVRLRGGKMKLLTMNSFFHLDSVNSAAATKSDQ